MQEFLKTRTVQEEQAFVETLNDYHPEWLSTMSERTIAGWRHFFVSGVIAKENELLESLVSFVPGEASAGAVLGTVGTTILSSTHATTRILNADGHVTGRLTGTGDVIPLDKSVHASSTDQVNLQAVVMHKDSTFPDVMAQFSSNRSLPTRNPMSWDSVRKAAGIIHMDEIGEVLPSIHTLSDMLGIDVKMPIGTRLIRELEHRFPTEVRTNESCTEAYIVAARSSDMYTIGYWQSNNRPTEEHVCFWLKCNGSTIVTEETPMKCLEAWKEQMQTKANA